jgi:hypothetical protein
MHNWACGHYSFSESKTEYVRLKCWVISVWSAAKGIWPFRCFAICAGAPQQVVTQIIRGQPVSTAISAPSTASSTPGHKGLTPGTSTTNLQSSTPQPPRPQQGQVKLTMAQLTQLTQGHVSNNVTWTLDMIWFSLAVSSNTCTYFDKFQSYVF